MEFPWRCNVDTIAMDLKVSWEMSDPLIKMSFPIPYGRPGKKRRCSLSVMSAAVLRASGAVGHLHGMDTMDVDSAEGARGRRRFNSGLGDVEHAGLSARP